MKRKFLCKLDIRTSSMEEAFKEVELLLQERDDYSEFTIECSTVLQTVRKHGSSGRKLVYIMNVYGEDYGT